MSHIDIDLVFGRRKGGKSTLARALVEDCPKVLAFDPQADLEGEGYRICRTRRDVREGLKRDWNHDRVRVAYVPDMKRADPMDEADFLAREAVTAQSRWRACEDRRALRFMVDEAHMSYPNQRMPADCRTLDYLTLQGRHDGIGMVLITQRPANLNMNPRGNAERVFAFALPAKNDRKAICDIHSGASRYIDRLDQYECIRIDGVHVTKMRAFENGTLKKVA